MNKSILRRLMPYQRLEGFNLFNLEKFTHKMIFLKQIEIFFLPIITNFDTIAEPIMMIPTGDMNQLNFDVNTFKRS